MNPIQPGGSVQDIARSLLQTFDSNRDGNPTADEFGTFLNRLLTGIRSDALPAGAVRGAVAGAAAGSPGVRFEGFDLSRPQDPQRSAKDAFAMLASQAGTMPRTKAEAEAWFTQNIRGEMERLGHRVNWVRGDKFQFTNWQGTFEVDFLRGADGPDPAFAWQVE